MDDRKPHDTPAKQSADSLETYFRNIIVLNQAFAEQPFRDTHAETAANLGQAPEHAVLWLGCNVLRTPHLAQLAASIMRLLDPGLSVLGGPSHCCGSPIVEKTGRDRTLNRTIGHFQNEHTSTLVSWCPSCHTNLRAGSDASSWNFSELHITEFIARRLDRLKLSPRLSARVVVHGHTGAPDRDKDMEFCRTILRRIPGITIVAEHADTELGLHCVPAIVGNQIGAEAFERKLAELLDEARGAKAEMLVTIYHSCYRELEKRLRSGPLVIENYITLLARALDLPIPANVYREMAHGGDARRGELQSDAESRSIDRAELARAMDAEFSPPRVSR
ncbi:MAG: heterodisulfide reductase-related iron-sulfur binding cluster [Candidatus Binataceae bacterium]